MASCSFWWWPHMQWTEASLLSCGGHREGREQTKRVQGAGITLGLAMFRWHSVGRKEEFSYLYQHCLLLKWEHWEGRGTGATEIGKDLFLFAQLWQPGCIILSLQKKKSRVVKMTCAQLQLEGTKKVTGFCNIRNLLLVSSKFKGFLVVWKAGCF